MTITIHSNGSKWAGQPPDDLETLIDTLAKHTLDRTFERYGNFVETDKRTGKVVLFGNFIDLSHVFQITADSKDEVAHVIKAIARNKKRPEYLAQPKPARLRALPRRRWPRKSVVANSAADA